jgi:hypothetical protein
VVLYHDCVEFSGTIEKIRADPDEVLSKISQSLGGKHAAVLVCHQLKNDVAHVTVDQREASE